MQYQQPQITGERRLESQLRPGSETKIISDAEIKHGVAPIHGYEAPTISTSSSLDGALGVFISLET